MTTATGEAPPLGMRIARLRKLNGLTLEALARLAGITKGYLSKVERGASEPSISTVLKLAGALGLSAGELLDELEASDDVVVVRPTDRVPFARAKGREGYVYEAIAAHRANKVMTPFIMRPPVQDGGPLQLVEHAGEELIHVISGAIELVFEDRRVLLQPGDSAYFNASVPHRSRSIGPEPAEALVVVAPTQPRRAVPARGSG